MMKYFEIPQKANVQFMLKRDYIYVQEKIKPSIKMMNENIDIPLYID